MPHLHELFYDDHLHAFLGDFNELQIGLWLYFIANLSTWFDAQLQAYIESAI